MAEKFSHFVLNNRKLFIFLILIYTAFMGYKGLDVEYNYDFSQTVPDTDEEMMYYNSFKNTFGEDGNVFAIGLKDSSIFNIEKFKLYNDYVGKIEGIYGVKGALGLPRLQALKKNNEKKNFNFINIFDPFPNSQDEYDSLLIQIKNEKFYEGKILNDDGALTLLVTIDKNVLNSESRNKLMDDLISTSEKFSSESGIKLHYAGLPYSRYILAESVKKELTMLLIVSVIVLGIILFIFFRSIDTVFVPLIIIGIVVTWVFGTLALFGFKITLLTGLLPPIIVVIGIPNCVYMLNYYHFSIEKLKDKKKAIQQYKLAAIGGHEGARHSLGAKEGNDGNMERAYKHFMIAARGGNNDSLKKVGEGYKAGYVPKDEYASTLRAYQVSVDEMKSEQRTKAAAM